MNNRTSTESDKSGGRPNWEGRPKTDRGFEEFGDKSFRRLGQFGSRDLGSDQQMLDRDIARMEGEGGSQRYDLYRRNRRTRAEERHLEGEQHQDERWGQQRDESHYFDPYERRIHARESERDWWQSEAPSVADVMTSQVKTISPEADMRTVAELMRDEDVGVVPVVEADGRLFGLITDRDLVIRGLASEKPTGQCRARDLASRSIEVASTHDHLPDIINLMGRQQIRRVPVLDDQDRLVGIVSLSDVANRADNSRELQKAFERISGRRSFWSRIWR